MARIYKPRKYQPKLPLWPTQKKGLDLMGTKKYFALLMAMRTGKSPTAIANFGQLELNRLVEDGVVIAPKGAIHSWVENLKDHVSDDLRKRLTVHSWESGSARGRKEFSQANGPRLMLMNIEALSRPGDARKYIIEFLEENSSKTMTIIDESSKIKNKSKRTQFILKNVRKHSEYRRILSGLATPQSPLDLFYQFEFLDWRILGFNNWYAFRAHIAFLKKQWFGGRSVILIDKEQGNNGFRPEATEELQQLIKPHSYRVPFRPKVPSTFTIREVELTKEQTKHYNEIREYATTKLANETHVTANVVIAQIMRMHQVLCGHVRNEGGDLIEIPENKTAALLDLLEDYDGKAIIWCSYQYNVRKVREALLEAYGPGSVALFYGDNVKTREDDVLRFKRDKVCRFMVSTPDSGGMGNTWDVADLAVYYSSKDNLEHRDQSEQRTMGVKKERGVDNVDLIAPNTVEMKILQALREKINMATIINGDNYKEWLI